jgi:hypothetical protein
MTRRFKTLAALGLPGLLLAGSLYLGRTPPSAPPPGPAVTDPGEGTLAHELRRGARLDGDRPILLWTSSAKRWVAGEVAGRRLGLLEGAAALRAIDARRPAHLRLVVWGGCPGCPEDEGYCRSMLGWVQGEATVGKADPARVAELEAELGGRLDGPAPLRLPDVSLERCLPAELLPVPSAPAGPAGNASTPTSPTPCLPRHL